MLRSSRNKWNGVLSAFVSAVLSAGLLMLAWPSGAAAAGFSIVKLVDGMNRPDLPCCTPFYIFYTPVISGNRVAFLSRNGPPDGVWSGDIITKALTKLVGLGTPVPGGTGNFTEFFGGTGGERHSFSLAIGAGTVAFFGRDAVGVWGLFTVPVTGGAVRRIATTGTTSPDGGNFSWIDYASTNGTTVVFHGQTAAHSGVYRANRFGGHLQTVIDSDDRLDARSPSGPVDDYFSNYTLPVIGRGANIAFYAGGLFDPVSGANAIFRAAGFVDVADNMTRLPGRPDNSHVRITALSGAVGSAAVAYRADQPNNGFAGIFKARNKNTAHALVTTKTRVPGTHRKFSSFHGFGYDDTGLAFTAVDPRPAGALQSVYFTPGPEQPIVRIASGLAYYFPIVGDRSVSNGRVVFMDGSNYADTVYVAVPVEP